MLILQFDVALLEGMNNSDLKFLQSHLEFLIHLVSRKESKGA